MKYLILIPILISIVACAGAPKYLPKPGIEHTNLYIDSSNDSTGTTLRRLDASVYKGKCEFINGGAHLGFDTENDSSHVIPSVLIPVGEEITLKVLYQDAKINGNRFCGVSVKFEPLKGHVYEGKLTVIDNARKCSIIINDITQSKTIDLNVPDYTCGKWGGVNKFGVNMQPVQN